MTTLIMQPNARPTVARDDQSAFLMLDEREMLTIDGGVDPHTVRQVLHGALLVAGCLGAVGVIGLCAGLAVWALAEHRYGR